MKDSARYHRPVRIVIPLLALLVAFAAEPAWAFKLTPMIVAFDPSGPGASKAFIIENESADKIAVQVSMAHRKPDLDGNEELPDAGELFIVYPTQMILQAREKRTVRVSWAGPKDVKSELPFRIVAEQLPVEGLKEKTIQGAQIQVLLKYQGTVYVEPPEVKSQVSLFAAEPAPGAPEKLAITVANDGTRHQLLNEPMIRLQAITVPPSSPVEMSGDSLKEINGQNVLAGQKRRFVLPWPKGLPKAKLEAKLEFKP